RRGKGQNADGDAGGEGLVPSGDWRERRGAYRDDEGTGDEDHRAGARSPEPQVRSTRSAADEIDAGDPRRDSTAGRRPRCGPRRWRIELRPRARWRVAARESVRSNGAGDVVRYFVPQ